MVEIRPLLRTFALATAISSSVIFAPTGVALAAGPGGYAPSPGPTPWPVPGFTNVLTARICGRFGAKFTLRDHRTTMVVAVPRGDFMQPTQVVVLDGDNATVVDQLEASLRGDKPIMSFGVNLARGGDSVSLEHPITIGLSNAQFLQGDVVAAYQYHTGQFVESGVITKSGEVTVAPKFATEFAVLAPRGTS